MADIVANDGLEAVSPSYVKFNRVLLHKPQLVWVARLIDALTWDFRERLASETTSCNWPLRQFVASNNSFIALSSNAHLHKSLPTPLDGGGCLPSAQDQPVPETPGVVIGNTTPKYTARNPAIRWLTKRWVTNLEAIFDRIGEDPGGAPKKTLEVGCGEGVIAGKLQDRFNEVVALDLPDAGLRRDWRAYKGPRFLHADALALPFQDSQFDLVVAVEVLEHLADPIRGLREMARVGRRHLVLSVPQEPIFRCCNLIAGRYVRDLGNTPGHLHHWSKRGFTRFVSTLVEVREVTTPFPWTTIWARLPD